MTEEKNTVCGGPGGSSGSYLPVGWVFCLLFPEFSFLFLTEPSVIPVSLSSISLSEATGEGPGH